MEVASVELLTEWPECDALLSEKQLDLLEELSGAVTLSLKSALQGTEAKDEDGISDFEAFYCHRKEQDAKLQQEALGSWNWLEQLAKSCGAVCAELEGMLSQLGELTLQQQVAARKTVALCEQSEPRLRESARLSDTAKAIEQRVGMFDHVAEMMRVLEHDSTFPSPSELEGLLHELDNSAAYLEAHHEFHEAPKHIQHFAHLRHRACLTIRGHVQRSLERAASQVEQQLNEYSEHGSVATQVFYTPFQATASTCRPLVDLLRRRMRSHQEYATALDELEAFYRELRLRLVGGTLREHLEAVAACVLPPPPVDGSEEDDQEAETTSPPAMGSLADALQQAGSYLCDLSVRERRLFQAHIGEVQLQGRQEELPALLSCLAGTFYQVLRPAVFYCTSLDALRESADRLQVEFLERQRESGGDVGTMELSIPLATIAKLHQELLQWLITHARTQIYNNIARYQPSELDLDYPGRLTRPGNRGWFPSLEETSVVLAKTYQVLEAPDFEVLAQEAVAACLSSLKAASGLLAQRPIPSSAHEWCSALQIMDGQLFLIKHLLILREQVAFEQGSATTKGQVELRRLRSETNSRIDLELKQACASFITDLTARVILPLSILDAKTGNGVDANSLQHAIHGFLANLRSLLPAAVALVRAYLAAGASSATVDRCLGLESTVTILLNAVQNRLSTFCQSWVEKSSQQQGALAEELGQLSNIDSIMLALLEVPLKASWTELANMVAEIPRGRPFVQRSSGNGVADLPPSNAAYHLSTSVVLNETQGWPAPQAEVSLQAPAEAPEAMQEQVRTEALAQAQMQQRAQALALERVESEIQEQVQAHIQAATPTDSSPAIGLQR